MSPSDAAATDTAGHARRPAQPTQPHRPTRTPLGSHLLRRTSTLRSRPRGRAPTAKPGAYSYLGLGALVLVAAGVARAEPASPVPAVEPNGAVGLGSPAEREVASSVSSAPAPLPGAECVGDRFVVLHETGFEPALAAEVRTDFATELAHRGLGVCTSAASSSGEPAAVVELEARDSLVIISLDDRVTHKRVARDLSLQAIPANGRALAIAIAIDELLRASWAELTLRRPEGEEEEDEDDGYTVVETQPINAREHGRTHRSRRAAVATRYHLGADVGYLHTAHNFDAFALDARASVRPWGWGWFDLSLGGLAAVPAHSADGNVVAAGMRAALTAGACARSGARVSGCAGPRAELDVLSFHGVHPKLAEARRAGAAVVHGSLVALLAVSLREQTYMFGELALGAVLHGAEATNGSRTLMGVTGMLLSLNVGLGYEL